MTRLRYALDVEVVRLTVVGKRYLLDDLLDAFVEVKRHVRLVLADWFRLGSWIRSGNDIVRTRGNSAGNRFKRRPGFAH
jgi:hypothetical protein